MRVVVLGGGFAGVYAARRLEHLARKGAPLDITLVSQENFFLFTPMLHEIAASDLDVTHIVSPLRTLLRRTQVFVGSVESSISRSAGSWCPTASTVMRTKSSTPRDHRARLDHELL